MPLCPSFSLSLFSFLLFLILYSVRPAGGAIVNYNWTETTQSKWLLRRMVPDFYINMSLLTFKLLIIGAYTSGLLQTNCSSLAVIHVKEAYQITIIAFSSLLHLFAHSLSSFFFCFPLHCLHFLISVIMPRYYIFQFLISVFDYTISSVELQIKMDIPLVYYGFCNNISNSSICKILID